MFNLIFIDEITKYVYFIILNGDYMTIEFNKHIYK